MDLLCNHTTSRKATTAIIGLIAAAVDASTSKPARDGRDSDVPMSDSENENPTTETEHSKERKAEGETDPHRQVGDRNKVIENGTTYTDTSTGNTVHVNGDKVVITDGNGKKISSFKNTKKNTRKRIDSERWVKK